MSNLEFQNAVREVLKLSAVDPGFRQLAVTDGRAAMSRVGNVQPPDRPKVNFVDNYRKSAITIPLPDPVKAFDFLDEEDLESPAGVDCGVTCPQTCFKTALFD